MKFVLITTPKNVELWIRVKHHFQQYFS